MEIAPKEIKSGHSYVLYDSNGVAYYAGKTDKDLNAYVPANKNLYTGTKSAVKSFIESEGIAITEELLSSL